MQLAIYVAAAAAALIARIFLPFLKTLFSPLRKVSGPFAARFTDLWYFLRVRNGKFHLDNIELHKKHGEVVRYGPNRYSFSSQAALKTIYGHGAKFPKSDWYETWKTPGASQWSLFPDRSIPRHSENRRQYQSMYSMSSLITYEPYVDECAELFSQRLQELASAGMYTDMGHWLQCYAFDVIGMITFSKRLGFLDRGEDVRGVMSALEDHMMYASTVGVYSWLHKYLYPIRNWLAGPTGAGRAHVMKFTQECMADHERTHTKGIPVDGAEQGKSSMDFLTKFYKKHAENPQTFTMYHLVVGCISNMVAGSDTTGISVSAILYYLLKNPTTFETLRREVDEQRRKAGPGHYFSFQDSQTMPYLQAVIKEALRMHPATGLPLERVVPSGGAQIGDYFFPEGTVVGINTWVMHRDTTIFGPDANEFRPERWLDSDKEKLSLMERNWMPFGLGSRTCIGRHISLLEIAKLVPMLVSKFDFTLASHLQDGEWDASAIWFVKPRGFQVKVAVRQQ
ncbi:hypothetical protein ACJQWK_03492 [Exserohilum turcicum]